MRDGVRMLVATGGDGSLVHARFRSLPEFLEPGDLVVVNTSATLPAAVPVLGSELVLHLSTPVPDGPESRWVVELRRGDAPYRAAVDGCTLELPDGAWATVLAPYLAGPRLWIADLHLPAARARLSRRARPADPLPLRARGAPARGLSDRLRDRARQRRDAERRPPVHRRARDRARLTRHRRRAGRPSHGRVVARGRRGAVPGEVPRARVDRAPGGGDARRRRPSDRGRHDRRACARVGRPGRRSGGRGRGAGRTSCSRRSAACGSSTGS